MSMITLLLGSELGAREFRQRGLEVDSSSSLKYGLLAGFTSSPIGLFLAINQARNDAEAATPPVGAAGDLVATPNVVGTPLEDAEKRLKALDLIPVRGADVASEQAKDVVVSQSVPPSPPPVKTKTPVTLDVSKGPGVVVSGTEVSAASVQEAITILQRAMKPSAPVAVAPPNGGGQTTVARRAAVKAAGKARAGRKRPPGKGRNRRGQKQGPAQIP